MRLAGTTYQLEDYELPDHLFLNGTLDLEICHIDEAPYIWSFELEVWSEATNRKVKHYFTRGQPDNHPEAVAIKNALHKDQKLMDHCYEACADAAS